MRRILVVEDEDGLREHLSKVLETAGFAVTSARDGVEALHRLRREEPYDLMLLDVSMPRMNGLELLTHMRSEAAQPKVIVMTAEDTPETILRAVREQAYQYVSKPPQPDALVNLVRKALETPSGPRPIEVLSARPDWVELLVPCELEAADRIQSFLAHLEADLPDEVRESVGQAFRELLLNAIEWGGQLDPNRRVRIAYLRGRRMLLYRIADPGGGFRFEGLAHAAVNNPPGQPDQHLRVRQEKGLRPGGFGLLMVRAMVDELLYNEAQNEVLFLKYTD
jgi:CheY-like chemotaxis protein/anti-sigma regulatory factor (Ser/Thr protein kinase)